MSSCSGSNSSSRVKNCPVKFMKSYVRVTVRLYAFLTLVLDEGEWSASHPLLLYPRRQMPQVPISLSAGYVPRVVKDS